MTDRDRELDEMLSPLKNIESTPMEVARWKRSLDKAKPNSNIWKIAAAFIVGIGLGVGSTHFMRASDKVENIVEENSSYDATIVQVTVNS